MPRKKKIQIEPKSKLGLDDKLHICYNCLFRHKDTGYCPMYNEYYDYNHKCPTDKIFRYRFDLIDKGYRNKHI